jgi:RNA polymerase sigma-70 factor (ECF subfamily)
MLYLSKKRKFEEIFRKYYPLLCLYSNKYIGNMSEAEDVVSQFFCDAYEKEYFFKIKSSLSSYMYTSVRNLSIKYLKDHLRHSINIDKQFEHTYNFELSEIFDGEVNDDSFERIKTCIQQLPPQCRIIFEMKRMENKKYKEIAQELGISVSTVETQMSRAMKKLKAMYLNSG